MNAALKKKLSLLLAPVLLLSLFAGLLAGAAAENDAVYLAFSSDVHYGQAGNTTLHPWLDWLKTKVARLDALGFCGDMGNNNTRDVQAYWQSVQTALDLADGLHSSGFIAHKPVYVFGNHEWKEGQVAAHKDHKTAQRFQNQGEAIRTDKYAIYGFGASLASPPTRYEEQDIARLKAYMETVPEDIPVIILTHFPLYDYSTIKTENADKVIQVLNEHPNVVCFWGHYHAVVGSLDGILTAGSTLPVSGKNMTINFTYLQAGCLNTNGTQKRGTLMKLTADAITLTRYDDAGAIVDSSTIALARKPALKVAENRPPALFPVFDAHLIGFEGIN